MERVGFCDLFCYFDFQKRYIRKYGSRFVNKMHFSRSLVKNIVYIYEHSEINSNNKTLCCPYTFAE